MRLCERLENFLELKSLCGLKIFWVKTILGLINPIPSITHYFEHDNRILNHILERHNLDSMSTCSGLTNPHSEVSRGRTRTRRFSGQSDSGLPPSGFGMRQRQGSISSLISNKSGNELIQGLEEYRIRNREDLSREQIEAQVMKI